MGYIKTEFAEIGKDVDLEVRGKKTQGKNTHFALL
jgi:hypothetical protein